MFGRVPGVPQNAITSINVVGMLIVILGVFLYNHARINVRPLPLKNPLDITIDKIKYDFMASVKRYFAALLFL